MGATGVAVVAGGAVLINWELNEIYEANAIAQEGELALKSWNMHITCGGRSGRIMAEKCTQNVSEYYCFPSQTTCYDDYIRTVPKDVGMSWAIANEYGGRAKHAPIVFTALELHFPSLLSCLEGNGCKKKKGKK